MFYRIEITQRGDSRLKNFIIILISAGIVYAGYKIIPVYIDYYRVKNMFAAELNTARDMPIEFVQENVKRKIRELSLPVPENAVVVEMEDHHGKIYATYTVVVQFPFDYYMEFTFNPFVEKEFK